MWRLRSGHRRFLPEQRAPSPRYANCIVGGEQSITTADNSAQVPDGVDEEWYAVVKDVSQRYGLVPPPAVCVHTALSPASGLAATPVFIVAANAPLAA